MKKIKILNVIIFLKIWESCGKIIYEKIIANFYNSNLILIFYDAQDKSSFDKAKYYFQQIKATNNESRMFVLIRSKYENTINEKNDFISDEEALKFVDKNNIYFFHFFHIGIKEKYEAGINVFSEFILREINELLIS